MEAGALPIQSQPSAVREYREKAGLSQEALARKVEVSRQTIVNIERGSEPRVLLALAIAAVLGVAVSDLFRRSQT
jgi:putative transcriptional regulator